MEFRVPTTPCPLIFDTLFVIGIFILGIAIGIRFLKVLNVRLDAATPLEVNILSAMIGVSSLQFLPYGLGMFHQLKPGLVWVGLAVLAILFSFDILQLFRSAIRHARSFRWTQPPLWMLAVGALLVIVLINGYLRALCPPTTADTVYYHLVGPKRWLQGSDLRYLPSNTMSEFPMGMEMLFTIAMAVCSDTAASLIHFAYGLLVLAAIYALGSRLHDRTVGFVAAAAYCIIYPRATFSQLDATAYVDLGIACLFIGALLCWFIWRRERSTAWIITCGTIAGLAATFKLTGIVLSLFLALLTIIDFYFRKKRIKEGAAPAFLLAIVAWLPLSPWIYRTWTHTGNPVYPFLVRIFPSRDMDAWTSAIYIKKAADAWGIGSTMSPNTRHAIVVVFALLLSIFLLATFRRLKNVEQRQMVLFSLAATVFYVFSAGLVLRYLMPPMTFLVVAVMMILRPMLERKWVQNAYVLLLVLCLPPHLTLLPRLPEAFRVATGIESRSAYLHTTTALNIPMDLMDYVNTHLTQQDKILMFGYCFSYYSDPYCYICTSYVQHHIRCDRWEEFLSDVKRDDIRYVITCKGPGIVLPREWELNRALLKNYGTLLMSSGELEFYRLDFQ